MAEVASAYVSLIPSFRGGPSAISKELGGPVKAAGVEGGKSYGSGMKAGIAGMAKNILGPLAAVAGGAALVGFFKGAVAEASGLNESVNALNVSYGEASAGVQALGKQAATSLGLSNLEFNNLAVRFSSFSKTIAGEGGDVTGTLDALTTRASDFASVMNLDVAGAAQLFQSGLAGESEPLRQFGIDMSAAAVEAYGLANGLAANRKSLTEAEKIQARYGLLMEQTAATQGDFASTSDQLANQQRILGATFDDVKARIGTAFLPAITSVVSYLAANVGPAFEKVESGVQSLLAGLSGQGPISGFTGALNTLGLGLRATVAAFKDGDVTSDGFVGAMERVGVAARVVVDFFTGTIIPGIRALAAAFKAGGSDVTSSGFAGGMERIGLAARALADFVTGSLIPGIASLVGWLRENQAWLLPIAVGIGTVVVAFQAYAAVMAVVRIATAAWVAVQGLLNVVLAANPIGIVILLIAGLVAALVFAWHNSETFRNVVTGAWEAIKSAVSGVVDWFRTAVPAVFEFIKSAFLRYTPLGLVISHWDQIMAAVGGVVAWLRVAPAAAFEFIKSAFLRFTPLGIIISHWDQIQSAVSTGVSNVVSFVRELPGRIVSALGNLGQALYSAGQALLQGLINGIRDKVSGAVQAVKDAVSGVIDGAKNLLGINSPSRVFMKIGRNTGEGMRLGIEQERQAVAGAMSRMVETPNVLRSNLAGLAAANPDGLAGNAFPSQVMLMDEQGGLLTTARVVTGQAMARQASRSRDVAQHHSLRQVRL